MPIEDLDYLYKNSLRENIIVLVDSNRRDKIYWKSPNDFRIDFEQPFKYVYGVDILDISIPRTMFSIDKYNDEMFVKSGYIINDDFNNDLQEFKLKFINRDYTVKEIIEEMSVESNPMYTNNISVTIEDNVELEERKSVIMYTNLDNPPKPFIFDMKKSTINEALGFDEVAQSTYPEKYSKYHHEDNEYLFASVPIYNTNGKKEKKTSEKKG